MDSDSPPHNDKLVKKEECKSFGKENNSLPQYVQSSNHVLDTNGRMTRQNARKSPELAAPDPSTKITIPMTSRSKQQPSHAATEPED